MKFGKLENIPPKPYDLEFNTVGQLIDYLEILGRERSLMWNLDGSTFKVGARHINLWDDGLDNSPVQLVAPLEWED